MSHVAGPADDPLHATEVWFVRHGLPYFVPSERAAARRALEPRRLLPHAAGWGLAAVVLGVLLAWAAESVALGPALWLTVGILFVLGYGVTALRARPIVTWAVGRTLGQLRRLLPMVSRALPLLLIFVTFLFINAEVWQVAAHLDGGVLWLTVLLFTAIGLGFFLTRLPEEVDRVDDELDDARVLEVSTGTPIEHEARRLAAEHPGALSADVVPRRFERANLLAALLISQAVQVLLLAATVFVFFVLFGALTMTHDVQQAWTAEDVDALSWLPTVTPELIQVSVFLGAFSGLYFTVSLITDDAYRGQFYVGFLRELERAAGVRAAYTAVRAERARAAAPPEAPRDGTVDATPTMPFPAVPREAPGDVPPPPEWRTDGR
ncbi:hypothetical protein [Nocardioides caldifontis]|uniref:hypothetical protein n=1 Tax=Nocardioides caldifontis TaxID=2588938 RepID=UPI001939EEF5|nr:hypothetical protein [Nocardioides caldifontis]